MSAIQTLLRGSIDYAGLFPPAGLPMAPAVVNYAKYRAGPAAWALGRFIVPVSRLVEFEANLPPDTPGPWRLGVLAGTELPADLNQVAEFNLRHASRRGTHVLADVLEVKADSESRIAEILRLVPADLQAFIEIPVHPDPADLVAAIGREGGRAKVRTGGVTPEAFPDTAQLLRFLQACRRSGVPLKATAGLHHPVRAEYPLTYSPDSPRGTMFGFLNLFLAVAFLRAGMSEALVARVLEEGSAEVFQADATGISWRDHRVDVALLRQVRSDGIISFGSCSFTEPIQDLESLHLIETPAHRA
ncbi:MAG TPA: hypothetical protein VF252_12190 [Gemmatimonadales bacterium]